MTATSDLGLHPEGVAQQFRGAEWLSTTQRKRPLAAPSDLGGNMLLTAPGTHRLAAASDFRLQVHHVPAARNFRLDTNLVGGCGVLTVLVLQAIPVALQLDDASLNLCFDRFHLVLDRLQSFPSLP